MDMVRNSPEIRHDSPYQNIVTSFMIAEDDLRFNQEIPAFILSLMQKSVKIINEGFYFGNETQTFNRIGKISGQTILNDHIQVTIDHLINGKFFYYPVVVDVRYFS